MLNYFIQRLTFEISQLDEKIFTSHKNKKRKHQKSITDKRNKSVDKDIFDVKISLFDKIKIATKRCIFNRYKFAPSINYKIIKCIRNLITYKLMDTNQINLCQAEARKGNIPAMSALLLNSLVNTIGNMANMITNLHEKITVLDNRLSKLWNTKGEQTNYLLTKVEKGAKDIETEEEKSNNILKSDVNIQIEKDAWINTKIDMAKETKDVEMKEISKDASKVSKYKMNEIKENIIARMNEVELLKKKNFCHDCGMIAHKNKLTDCPKRCKRCKGNHDTKVCVKNKLCNWCGKALGHNSCNENNANFIRRSIKCPICGLIGHFAEECRIKFIALGNVKFILNKAIKALSRNVNRFNPNAIFKKRQRRFRRPRRNIRK